MTKSQKFFLSRRCQWAFDPIIRSRGEDYFYRKCVSKPNLDSTHALFEVYGTETYGTKIDWKESRKNRINVECTCPYFRSGDFCKHVWASFLALDQVQLDPALYAGNSDIEVAHTLSMQRGLSEYANDSDDEDLDELVERNNLDAEIDAHYDDHRTIKISNWQPTLRAIDAISKSITPQTRVPAKIPQETEPLDLWFVLPEQLWRERLTFRIEFHERQTASTGESTSLKKVKLAHSDARRCPDANVRALLFSLLSTAKSRFADRSASIRTGPTDETDIPVELLPEILPALTATGRLLIQEPKKKAPNSKPLEDGGPEPWKLELGFENRDRFTELVGFLTRKDETRNLTEPVLILASGLILFRDSIGWLEANTPFGWILTLRRPDKDLVIPTEELESFAYELRQSNTCPVVRWPEKLKMEERIIPPTSLVFILPDEFYQSTWRLELHLLFDYEGNRVHAHSSSPLLYVAGEQVAYRRDLPFENQERAKLQKVVKLHSLASIGDSGDYALTQAQLPPVVASLIEEGLTVEALGKPITKASSPKLKLERTGIDWFDLSVDIEFQNGAKLQLPTLLKAIRERSQLVTLGDGSTGVLPADWLKRFSPLATLGTETETSLRLSPAQALLLQSTLKEDSQLKRSSAYRELQEQITTLTTPTPRQVGGDFEGDLRGYQSLGLGWLRGLTDIGVGGILADDMGLGKTIQALAYLDSIYGKKAGIENPRKPSLVVAPKSLLFNWRREAERFTPGLRVLSHEGPTRTASTELFGEHDLILVTYATLRNDFALFNSLDFHTIIADEAQAIKNPKSISSIACKSIRAKTRIAMTGTPVENSLNDLFSILDFTNPGLLAESARKRYLTAAKADSHDIPLLQSLTRAIRPFILRRTKEQVLSELPPKTEQILYCELSSSETKLYQELRDHYRINLDREINTRGIAKSQILIIEALLRLRQAACHPALLADVKTKRRSKGSPQNQPKTSTKVDLLLQQLHELAAEGRKALVFSQFTSFLEIVQQRLREDDISFEYLDGATQDRQERVDRFQQSPDSKVFLISLKAGGTGLNLTSADTVFLIDPWWNPAVEAQAIDRAHRIGQQNKVTAYRLIARNTVEEKILQLQERKRKLAETLIQGTPTEGSSGITREDLELLLS